MTTTHTRFASQFRHRPQLSISFLHALFSGNGIPEIIQQTRGVMVLAVLWPTPSLDDERIIVAVLVGRLPVLL
jgi:hypothetical protein